MNITPYSDDINQYLISDKIIDYDNDMIFKLSREIEKTTKDKIDYIKAAYEYVRDNISHSGDIDSQVVTCAASEVLREGHGICFAKSHLLAALLRSRSIPAGFCYQKLILDDETAPYLILHGLNGVYIDEYQKWIRLDARGNKTGIDAQFSVSTEKLAFEIRSEKGEENIFTVYPYPDKNILKALLFSKTRSQLGENIPAELAYSF